MNRGDVDIFGYNLGGSVSEMMRNPKLERDPLMTEEQAAYFASQLLPGAATLDATGNMPGMPSSDADLTDIFDAENNPSILENIRQGNILDPALQTLGVLGDATYAIPPLGATLGTALKAPGALRKAMKLTGGIDNLPQDVARVGDGVESVDAARAARAQAELRMADFRKIIDDEGAMSSPDIMKIIDEHPAVVRAVERMNSIPETSLAKNYGTDEWFDNRVFNFNGTEVIGYDDAIENLYENSKKLAWTDDNLDFPGIAARIPGDAPRAVIVIGPPASGKSSISNPIARKLNATIIDSDEAKKLLPEYEGGVGANAVHQESKLISDEVRDLAVGFKDNVVIPTVGAKSDVIRKQINFYKNAGYEVDLVNVSVPVDIARRRMYARFAKQNRLIPAEYIDAVGDNPNLTYNILREEGIADGYSKIDNSVGFDDIKPVLEDQREIFSGTNI